MVVESEKDAGVAHTPSPSSSSSSPSPSPRLGAGVVVAEEKEATPSLFSHTSSTSGDSDPLSPLEHALTTDLRTEAEHEAARAELVLIQTRTSIGSSASRMPDFEVIFDSDDSENPRNWYVTLYPTTSICSVVVTVPPTASSGISTNTSLGRYGIDHGSSSACRFPLGLLYCTAPRTQRQTRE